MKRRTTRLLSLLLTAALFSGLFAACTNTATPSQTSAQTPAATTAASVATSTAASTAASSSTPHTTRVFPASSVPTPATSKTDASSTRQSGASSDASETAAAPATDYNAVFAEYGIEPSDELIPWACYFVDNFPVGECDVRFVDLADGDNPEMLVTHFQYDKNGLFFADVYLCVMDSRGTIAAAWSYRLQDNSQGQYRAAYLVDFDGKPALLMYYRLTFKGTTTERYDIYRFDEDGNRIMVSAEESSFPDSQLSDTALFKDHYAPRLKNAIVVVNFPSPWNEAVFYDESLPAHAFAEQNTPINQLRREGDNFIAITSYAIDKKTSAVSIKGYALRYAGGKDTFGRCVYDATAVIEFTCPGDTGVTYKTETGEQASVSLLSFLQGNLSAFGTVIYDGAQPVYRFRTLHGEIVGITEP